MNKIITIYCEGVKGSHDYDIIDKVKDSINPNVSIQPIGSKRGAGSAIQVYEKSAVKSDVYFLFRDRDFDVEVPMKPSLTMNTEISKYTYFSYRTTIENYLFDTGHFYAFLHEKNLKTKYKIHNVADVKSVFVLAAKKIAYYQALRHTMGKMRIPTDFGTTWLDSGSGTLPEKLDDRTHCRQKALEKIEQSKLRTGSWTASEFDVILDSFCQFFDSNSFYDDTLFLVWFQGKDFKAALMSLLPEFPMESYYKYAKNHFDYTQFEDLVELRRIIETHTNRP